MRRRLAIHFFAIQFISTLADEGLLPFNHDEGRWSWDLGDIHAKGYTNNVVDLMVGKLNRLPVETQAALQAACLSWRRHRLDPATPSFRRLVEEIRTPPTLGRHTSAGLIFDSGDSYRFVHEPRPGIGLFVDPGRVALRGTPSNREAARQHTLLRRRERREFSRSSIS